MKATEAKEDTKVVTAFHLNRYDIDDIQKLADDRFDGNRSMAMRWLIADWRYLTARDLARGRAIADRQPADLHARAEAENAKHRAAQREHEKDPGGHA